MTKPRIGTRAEWRAAREALLAKEKEATRLLDELARERRALPWVPVEEDYAFEGEEGGHRLSGLFGPHSQLIIYHFMFGPDWDSGCPSCSFWADNFDGIDVHLAQRDAAFACVSRADYGKLREYRERMGWRFRWLSSAGSRFNFDYGASSGEGGESPGLSVFAKDGEGNVHHTYSTHRRGLDAFNGAYQILDLTPKGRDEARLEWPQQWVRRHDEYDELEDGGHCG